MWPIFFLVMSVQAQNRLPDLFNEYLESNEECVGQTRDTRPRDCPLDMAILTPSWEIHENYIWARSITLAVDFITVSYPGFRKDPEVESSISWSNNAILPYLEKKDGRDDWSAIRLEFSHFLWRDEGRKKRQRFPSETTRIFVQAYRVHPAKIESVS